MSDLREMTGITRTPEAETISSLKADLVAERAVSERLREANRELFGAVVRVVDPNVTPIEARLRGYSFRCRSKEEWVPFSDCLLGAAEEIERLRESNKELAAALTAKWRGQAVESREESGRIRRTIKEATDAEERCLVRAEVWDNCAAELEQAALTKATEAGAAPTQPKG